MEEAAELGNYLPLSFKTQSEQKSATLVKRALPSYAFTNSKKIKV